MEKYNFYLPTAEEIEAMLPKEDRINIFDQRDIDEIERRKKAKTCNPYRNELYSVNPNFDGIYTDDGRLTEEGNPMPGYYMGFIHSKYK